MSLMLSELFRRDWAFEMRDNPEFSSLSGFHDADKAAAVEAEAQAQTGATQPALQRVSVAAYEARAAHSREMRREVQEILKSHLDQLTPEEVLYARLFENQHAEVETSIDLAPLYLFPINSMGAGGVLNSFIESVEWMRFETEEDYQRYLRRLRAVPDQIQEFKDCMKTGLARGYVASQAMLRNVDSQLLEMTSGSLPELHAPLDAAPEGISSDVKAAIQDAIEGVRAALKSFLTFMETEYNPRARQDPSCAALPNGARIYESCLKFHTTTNLTAEEVFQIGIAEVAKIEARYLTDVLRPLGYAETAEDFARFIEHVRTAPEFYVKTPEELLNVYRKCCDEIAVAMPQYFSEIPKTPLEITSKQNGPAAYYLTGTPDGKRPGRFYVNVSHIEKRPLYEAVSLALHEAIPGHHHQISLATENASIPEFMRYIEDRRYECCPCRRNIYCGYAEGWALYCEYLGEEMGMYKTPYDLFGRLSMDMMRAVRLVVDTGLHYKGWSIEKCIDYMMEKTGMHRHEVETEIYRYATWPGQACAYKIGQIEFLRLRRLTEASLGDKFNLKDFHSLCLNSGPLPLVELSRLVESYIAKHVSGSN